MKFSDIARQRMVHQELTSPRFENPADVVAWQGAVQSQDYAGAKWAVAQRTRPSMTDAEMDKAFNDGLILRTHVMRPTWHFVTPADIRWMLQLTAPRVRAVCAYYFRSMELDDAIFRRSQDTLIKTLEGGKHFTRPQLAAALEEAGIVTEGLRLGYLIMRAELDGILCSGPRHGKQFTYALLEERVPPTRTLDRDEALAELTKRYFWSHGPALVKDFAWWSGLTMTEAKEGIELNKSRLQQESINGQSYWFSTVTPPSTTRDALPAAYLLPNYDEALASFKDYSAAVAPEHEKMWVMGDRIFSHFVVLDGWIAGSWNRTLTKKRVTIEFKPFRAYTDAESQAINEAAQRFGKFLGLELVLQ
jgi:hypothetical protein